LRWPLAKQRVAVWATLGTLRRQVSWAVKYKSLLRMSLQPGVLPAVNAIRLEGAKTLEAISGALHQQGIRTARGKRWHVSSVANLLARTKTFAKAG
jgi:hypothetical protein